MSDTPGTQTSEREIERQDLSGVPPVRWGFVGTGSIASSMAGVTTLTPLADLAAVSSRNLASAISSGAGERSIHLVAETRKPEAVFLDLR